MERSTIFNETYYFCGHLQWILAWYRPYIGMVGTSNLGIFRFLTWPWDIVSKHLQSTWQYDLVDMWLRNIFRWTFLASASGAWWAWHPRSSHLRLPMPWKNHHTPRLFQLQCLQFVHVLTQSLAQTLAPGPDFIGISPFTVQRKFEIIGSNELALNRQEYNSHVTLILW